MTAKKKSEKNNFKGEGFLRLVITVHTEGVSERIFLKEGGGVPVTLQVPQRAPGPGSSGFWQSFL